MPPNMLELALQDLELWITKEQLDDGFNLAVSLRRPLILLASALAVGWQLAACLRGLRGACCSTWNAGERTVLPSTTAPAAGAAALAACGSMPEP